MTEHWQKKELLADVAIFFVMGIFSYLVHLSSALLLLEIIFTIPIILYIYKNNINKRFVVIGIIHTLIQVIFFSYISAFVFMTLYLLPSILIGRFMRINRSFSLTVGYTAILVFIGVIFSIILYNQWYQTDLVNQYYQFIDYIGNEYVIMVDDMLLLNPSLSRKDLLDAIYLVIDVLKYYYIGIIFSISLFIVFMQTIIARSVAHLFGWKKFHFRRILYYSPPRSFALFFLFLFILQSLINQEQLGMAVDNLISICILVMLGVGFLLECYLISKVKSVLLKIVLLLFCLCVFIYPLYFIGLGFFEILFRFREKIKL